MSRISRESLVAGRHIAVGADHRRARSLAGGGGREDETMELDLFSGARGSLSIGSAKEIDSQDVLARLQRLTSGSAKRSGMDDLLDADSGKHDYDWLLTPPGTPPARPLNTSETPLSSTAPKRSSNVRSVSTTRASRVSPSQSENGHSTRPVRSSSVTRASSNISSNNRTSVLNTSSASVTSRPSTPSRRPATSTTKSSNPSSRPVPARSPTPVKSRPTPSSPGLKTGPSLNSRPSTPTSRARIPANLNSTSNSMTARSNSRSSTPTRQPIVPPSITSRSPSVGRTPATNGRTSAPSSRPSSPSPRPRAPVRPIDLPDFPNDIPPNLRTKLPERPVSAGRLRPGSALTVKANSNSEPANNVNSNRRLSLPNFAKGKFPENPMKVPLHSNGHHATTPEIQKLGLSDVGARRPSKPATTATESTGFGRNISKKSLDMALRHMDIRQSMGGLRGASVFPQSIRSAAPKGRPARMSDPRVPGVNEEHLAENANGNGTISSDSNGAVSCNGDSRGSKSPDIAGHVTRDTVVELDIYGSTRYDAMLLKEDSNNMNWLHSVEDKSDQSPVFEHRFEPLPEPFSPL